MEQQRESGLSSSLVLSLPAFPSKAATGTKPHSDSYSSLFLTYHQELSIKYKKWQVMDKFAF